jgi:Putative Flp pilus-assembly TadE/G-like
VIVLFALSLTMLVGALGFSIDMGVLRYMKRRQQSAADSAAIAGASEINFGDVKAAAQADSASNGFADGTNGVTVKVDNPPTSGPYTGKSNYVQVTVTQPHPTFFIKIVGIPSVTLSASAVSFLGNAQTCLYVLGPNGITMNGSNNTLNLPNCAITDNGDLALNGGGTVTASSIGVAGTVKHLPPPPGTQSPIVPVPDPLASLPKPSPGTCLTYNGGSTVSPGTYCSNITINGSVTFNPGLYVLTGNAVLTLNNSATVNGTGVTFYNTGTSRINFNGGTTATLSAPTTGTYAGILFFQDPSDMKPPILDVSASSLLNGAFYFPSVTLTMHGGSSATAYTILVVNSLVLDGHDTINLNADYSSLPGGSPIRSAALVE